MFCDFYTTAVEYVDKCLEALTNTFILWICFNIQTVIYNLRANDQAKTFFLLYIK